MHEEREGNHGMDNNLHYVDKGLIFFRFGVDIPVLVCIEKFTKFVLGG